MKTILAGRLDRCDHVRVSLRAARLDDPDHARLEYELRAVREREERVGGERGAAHVVAVLARLLERDPDRVDAARLASADPDRLQLLALEVTCLQTRQAKSRSPHSVSLGSPQIATKRKI